MVVIGGGVIGLELGSVWSRLGSQVTVIEFAKDICPPMDAQMRKTFERALKKQKFKFQMEKKVVGAVKTATGVKLTVEPSAGVVYLNYRVLTLIRLTSCMFTGRGHRGRG